MQMKNYFKNLPIRLPSTSTRIPTRGENDSANAITWFIYKYFFHIYIFS